MLPFAEIEGAERGWSFLQNGAAKYFRVWEYDEAVAINLSILPLRKAEQEVDVDEYSYSVRLFGSRLSLVPPVSKIDEIGVHDIIHIFIKGESL